MLADEVRNKLLAKVKKCKILFNDLSCTPSISNKEQMPLVIQCLDESENSKKWKNIG